MFTYTANIKIGRGCIITADKKAMASPESQAKLKADKEDQLRWKQEQQKKEQEEQKLKAEKYEHIKKWHELKNHNPPVGTVIFQPGAQWVVCVEPHKINPNEIVAYGLAIVDGLFPKEPYRCMACGGKSGLKVFLNKKSREQLERLNPEAWNAIIRGDDFCRHVFTYAAVRIIGYSENKMKAYGDLL